MLADMQARGDQRQGRAGPLDVPARRLARLTVQSPRSRHPVSKRPRRSGDHRSGCECCSRRCPGIGHLHPLLPLARGADRARPRGGVRRVGAVPGRGRGGRLRRPPRRRRAVDRRRSCRCGSPSSAAIRPGRPGTSYARAHVFAGALALRRRRRPHPPRSSGGDPTSSSATPPSSAATSPPSAAASRTSWCGPIPGAPPTPSDDRRRPRSTPCGPRSACRPTPRPSGRSNTCSCRRRRRSWTTPPVSCPPTWHHVRPPSSRPVRTSRPGSTGRRHAVPSCTPRSAPCTAGPTCWRRSSTRWPASRSRWSSRPAPSTRRRSGRSRPTSTSPAGSRRRDLLGRCDAVVTHAGFGTMAAALAHGVPLVMLPISADQPMNASRAAEPGSGSRSRPPTAPRGRSATPCADAHRRPLRDSGDRGGRPYRGPAAARPRPRPAGATRRPAAVLSGSCR